MNTQAQKSRPVWNRVKRSLSTIWPRSSLSLGGSKLGTRETSGCRGICKDGALLPQTSHFVTSGILSFPHLYSESSALDSIHVLSSFNIVGFQKMSRTYTELHFILNRKSWLELEVRGSATTVFSETLLIVSEHLLVCILPSHRNLSLDFPALSTNKSFILLQA